MVYYTTDLALSRFLARPRRGHYVSSQTNSLRITSARETIYSRQRFITVSSFCSCVHSDACEWPRADTADPNPLPLWGH